MVSEMADNLSYGDIGHQITSLYDVGRYMTSHIGDPKTGSVLWSTDLANAAPWAKYGMTAFEYDTKAEAFDSVFRTLTGQSAPQDLVSRALHEHQGAMTGQ